MQRIASSSSCGTTTETKTVAHGYTEKNSQSLFRRGAPVVWKRVRVSVMRIEKKKKKDSSPITYGVVPVTPIHIVFFIIFCSSVPERFPHTRTWLARREDPVGETFFIYLWLCFFLRCNTINISMVPLGRFRTSRSARGSNDLYRRRLAYSYYNTSGYSIHYV